jgi:hypothetical protein
VRIIEKRFLVVLFLLAFTGSGFSQDVTLERLVRAKYAIVAVQADRGEIDYGDSLTTNRDDRLAREEVEKSLRQWKRYTVTLHPHQAELLFLIRTARSGSVYVRTGPPLTSSGTVTLGRVPKTTTSDSRTGRGVAVGTEAQSPNVDLVEVYALDDGKQGMLLWRGMRKDGLAGSPPSLIEDYKKNVDKTAKKLGLP